MSKVIQYHYGDLLYSFTTEAWFNATEAAARFGKRLSHWLDNAETLEYIRALDEVSTGKPSVILNSRKSGYLKTRRGAPETGGGTWLHPDLAVPFARWLDVRFGVWCDRQIKTIMMGMARAQGSANLIPLFLRPDAAPWERRFMPEFFQQGKELLLSPDDKPSASVEGAILNANSIRYRVNDPALAGSSVAERHSRSAHGTASEPAVALDNQDSFFINVEARLTQIMQRLSIILLDNVRRLIDVGEGKRLPLVEVVQPIHTAVDDFRLELNILLNQCMNARLRRVELLKQLEVGSLRVDKPVFKV